MHRRQATALIAGLFGGFLLLPRVSSSNRRSKPNNSSLLTDPSCLAMLALRNHRLVAIPFSATASFLANIASISAWANTACFLWHPDTLKNHHLRTRSLASSTAHLRLRPIELVTSSSDASSWSKTQCRRYYSSCYGSSDGSCDGKNNDVSWYREHFRLITLIHLDIPSADAWMQIATNTVDIRSEGFNTIWPCSTLSFIVMQK